MEVEGITYADSMNHTRIGENKTRILSYDDFKRLEDKVDLILACFRHIGTMTIPNPYRSDNLAGTPECVHLQQVMDALHRVVLSDRFAEGEGETSVVGNDGIGHSSR